MRTTLFTLLLLITCSFSVLSANADTLVVQSEVMNKSIKNGVATPDAYGEKGPSYAVIYLLHGAGGNFSSWVSSMPSIKKYADDYNIILVFPDSGRTSWYFDSPVDEQMQYEKLLERRIPHDFIERPGSQTKPYRVNSIPYQMLFFNNFFNTDKEVNTSN